MQSETQKFCALARQSLRQVLDVEYVSSFQASKLKDGSRVYRVSGWRTGWSDTPGRLWIDRDGAVRVANKGGERGDINVNSRVVDEQNSEDAEIIKCWEYQLLKRGTALVEKQLREEIERQCEYPVIVEIGRGSQYLTSISIKVAKGTATVDAVQILIAQLPRAGSVWPKAERLKWLRLAESLLDVLYHEA
jgi:hypothetical protein